MQRVNLLLIGLLLLAPLAIWLFIDSVRPRYLAAVLVALLVIRFIFMARQLNRSALLLGWLLAMLSALLIIAIYDDPVALQCYPVLMNLGFLLLFAYSLYRPPTIVESIARIAEPELPVQGVHYTRQVTVVWCVFFLLNGSIAAWTVLYGSQQIWGLYNGIIAYLLMGLLMLVEYQVRQRQRRRFGHE